MGSGPALVFQAQGNETVPRQVGGEFRRAGVLDEIQRNYYSLCY